MFVEALLFLLAAYLAWYYFTRPPGDYPPTLPFRLPFLGHAHYIIWYQKTSMNQAFYDLYRTYSKDGMLAFTMGSAKFVFLGDFNLIKDSFKRDELSFRHGTDNVLPIMKRLRGSKFVGNEGIVESSGKTWQEQRRFMLVTLRDFGFGKSSMEDTIKDELVYFTEHLKQLGEQGLISVQSLFNVSILNVLWRIVAGVRYEYSDPELADLMKKVNDAITSMGPKPTISTIFPFLRKILPDSESLQKNIERTTAINRFLVKTIKEHKKNFDPDNISDYIDTYLQKMQETQDESSSFHGPVGEEHLAQALFDLFLAGSETTSSTLSWAVLFMIRHPDIQGRVREEMARVLGSDKLPQMSDKPKLPYTEATLMEIQRLGDVAPRGLSHSTFLGDEKVGKYTIPKGYTLFASLTNVHHSEEYWHSPERFNPDRHLDPSTGKIIRSDKLIPFSVGKRQCPGETLARAELFVFFGTLIQAFKFEAQDPLNPPGLDRISGVTAMPAPFKCRISRVGA